MDQAGYRLPLDERVLADTDTLFVFGLDHLLTEQEASIEEIEAVRDWLTREGTCLVLGPHHDVGISADLKARAMEYAHHGDALVPRQQRFGKYTRSLMAGLGVPVENRYGLRPGVVAGTSRIAPLTAYRDLDTRGWLNGVSNFSFHKHLPHYAVTTEDTSAVKVLATQPIDMSKPHPFTEAGQSRVQFVRVDATQRTSRGRNSAHGFNGVQHAVRCRRQPEAVLEESRHGQGDLNTCDDRDQRQRGSGRLKST